MVSAPSTLHQEHEKVWLLQYVGSAFRAVQTQHIPPCEGTLHPLHHPHSRMSYEYQIRPAFLVETGDFSFLLVLSSALLWWQFSAHRRKCFPSWGRRLLSCMRSAGCTNRLRAGTAGSGVLEMCLSAAPRAAFKGLKRRDFHFFLQ